VDLFALSQNVLRRLLVARGVRSDFLELRGQSIHYYEVTGTGHGPPALLVHGLAGSVNGFAQLLRPLAKRFSRVLAPDLPGHGFSPLPHGGPLPLMEQHAVLVDFCERMLKEPAFVVGNSLGGSMSITLAHEHPQYVKALALVAPGGARVSDERFQALAQTFQVATVAEARTITRRLFHRPPLLALAFASSLKPMYSNPYCASIFKELGNKGYLDPEVLESIHVPTLLLWGGSEKLLPFEGIDYFRRHLPRHAKIEIVPRFGHVPQVERPRELVKRLVKFADEHGL